METLENVKIILSDGRIIEANLMPGGLCYYPTNVDRMELADKLEKKYMELCNAI